MDGQYPSIIIRVDNSRLSPIRIIDRNPAAPRARIDPEDIQTGLIPGPATHKIPSWISKLAVNIAVKEYSENDVVAPLIWVWHGNIIMKGEIIVQANTFPIDKFLFFYVGIETYSAGQIISRFLGIGNARTSISITYNIRGFNPDLLDEEPGYPSVIISGIEGRIVHVEITVTLIAPPDKYFLIHNWLFKNKYNDVHTVQDILFQTP